MQRKFFMLSMILIGFASVLYTGWLIRHMDTIKYPTFYLYLRFFFAGWVMASVIISLAGETKKIGGIKSFLICLVNPALGLIMVMASENKQGTQLMNIVNRNSGTEIQKSRRIKNTSYTLNT